VPDFWIVGGEVSRQVRNYLLIILSLLLLSFFGCSSSAPQPQLEVTDQLGRVVKVNKIPQRIVSLDSADTEILFALGLGDKVVAVNDESDYPEEAQTKPSIGSFSTPDTKVVERLAPDLILASAVHMNRVIPELEGKGLTVLALDPKSLDEVLAAITLVGEVTQKQAEASLLVAGLRDRIKAVTDKINSIPESEKPTVFYVYFYNPLMTAGSGTLENDLIQKAGGINIYQDLKGYSNASLEEVAAANPQVIITTIDFAFGLNYNAPFEFITTEPSLGQIDAVRNEQVYSMWVEVLRRPGPRVVDGLEELTMLLEIAASQALSN
jgi:iron complex transport system substrate-binding protein